MPRQKLAVEVSRFSKGLVGAASAIDFPQDAATTLHNVEMNKDGSVRKRRGLAERTSMTLAGSSPLVRDSGGATNYQIGAWVLDNVANNGSVYFVTGAEGTRDYTLTRHRDTIMLEDSLLDPDDLYDATIRPLWEDSNDPDDVTIQNSNVTSVAQIGSRIVVGYRNHLYGAAARVYTFNDDNGAFLTPPVQNKAFLGSTGELPHNTDDIRVRDSWGMYDGRRVDEYLTPAASTPRMKYNAFNQGFLPVNSIGIGATEYVPARDHIAALITSGSLDKDLSTQPANLGPAPKGNAILTVGDYDRDYSKTTGSWGGTIDIASGALVPERYTGVETNVVSWGGRFFYHFTDTWTAPSNKEANLPALDTMICFSQTFTELDRYNKCFSINDPTAGINDDGTSKAFSDPTEEDGGVIVLDGTGSIISIVPFNSSLIVFAEHGIWEITGPFSPISYGVRKISEDTTMHKRSIVVLEDSVYFMGKNAISSIQPDVRSGRLYKANVSTELLGDLYKEQYRVEPGYDAVHSYYNSVRGTISWLYCEDLNDLNSAVVFDELVYDVALQAFYTNSYNIPEGTYILDVMENPRDSSDYCMITATYNSAQNSTKYTILEPNENLVYDRFDGINFINDWVVIEDEYESVIETGAVTFGSASAQKTVPWLTLYAKRTENGPNELDTDYDYPSSILYQTKWDFSSSAATNKWSDIREGYSLKRVALTLAYPDGESDPGHDVIVTKRKLRGRGRSFKMKLTIPAGKYGHVYGWSLSVAATGE